MRFLQQHIFHIHLACGGSYLGGDCKERSRERGASLTKVPLLGGLGGGIPPLYWAGVSAVSPKRFPLH
ncbi:Uncharacterized protein HZ326_29527 [Fusarium oxysporum f. sp. albedinis]|nr:Uncharacterized protein HZ326_29527 [Fusarium oxysporum f. sp. albedinis]